MTLIVASARRRADAPDDVVPYEIPATAPYNAPMPNITPTPDGTGIVIHPSVIDFHKVPEVAGDWNGWRYWQANTPMASDSQENPIILVSNNGFRWEVPAGLTNPLYGPPDVGTYNSDTDIEYDPDLDRLVLIYRTGDDRCWVADSPDGVTWPAEATLAFASTGTTPSTNPITHGLSPSLVRFGPGDWRVFVAYNSNLIAGTAYRTATDPLGTWSAPTVTPWSSIRPWHPSIIRDGSTLRAAVSGQHGRLYVASSTDNGNTWLENELTLLLSIEQGAGAAWEDPPFYRSTIQPWDEDTYQLWYTTKSANSWRMAYTRVPKSLWPA